MELTPVDIKKPVFLYSQLSNHNIVIEHSWPEAILEIINMGTTEALQPSSFKVTSRVNEHQWAGCMIRLIDNPLSSSYWLTTERNRLAVTNDLYILGLSQMSFYTRLGDFGVSLVTMIRSSKSIQLPWNEPVNNTTSAFNPFKLAQRCQASNELMWNSSSLLRSSRSGPQLQLRGTGQNMQDNPCRGRNLCP